MQVRGPSSLVPGAPTSKRSTPALFFVLVKIWCGRVDSNHHGIATASPSSWCVCQFRHDRLGDAARLFRGEACCEASIIGAFERGVNIRASRNRTQRRLQPAPQVARVWQSRREEIGAALVNLFSSTGIVACAASGYWLCLCKARKRKNL